MTDLPGMINGACRSRIAVRELSRYGLDLALRTGTLRELFPDVVVRGGTETDPLAVLSAAVAWCGDGVVCGYSAAWLYGVSDAVGEAHLVRRLHRNRRVPIGIVVHGGVAEDRDIRMVRGLPVLVPERVAAELLCSGDQRTAFALIDGAPAREPFVSAIVERLRDPRAPRGRVAAQRLLASASVG